MKAVQFRLHDDLAGQARIVAHVDGVIEHVIFFSIGGWDFVAPGFIDIHMTSCAGAGAAAFGFDGQAGVANDFHDAPAFDGV